MDKVISIKKTIELISEIRNLRKGFITNFYLDEFKHAIWIQKGDFYYDRVNDTCFFIKKDKGFWSVFYCSTDMNELENSLKLFELTNSDTVIMIDIVGNSEQCKDINKIFFRNGFYEYCLLVRMSKMTQKDCEEISNDRMDFANQFDVKYILTLLEMYFDSRCEQVPYLEELEEYAKSKRILCYKENNETLGFLIFEMNKTTLYLRYWFVHPEHRDKKIGSALLNRFFYEGKETRRQLFWVIADNENAIKRYAHYGFSNENMYDYVLTNDKNESANY